MQWQLKSIEARVEDGRGTLSKKVMEELEVKTE